MQQVIQHILLLTRNVEVAVELEMVHQVLINFDNLLQIERYIEEAYQLSGRVYLPYFQVQFISVIFDTDELAIIQSSQISYSRRMKRQQKLTKNLQQEKQGRQNKKIVVWQKCMPVLKVLQDMKRLKKVIGYVKRQKQEK